MSERKLYIVIEEFDNSEEARRIFERRRWKPVKDQSTPLPGTKLTRKILHNTPLIDLSVEEYEYGTKEGDNIERK
jgi:hypothetical protein